MNSSLVLPTVVMWVKVARQQVGVFRLFPLRSCWCRSFCLHNSYPICTCTWFLSMPPPVPPFSLDFFTQQTDYLSACLLILFCTSVTIVYILSRNVMVIRNISNIWNDLEGDVIYFGVIMIASIQLLLLSRTWTVSHEYKHRVDFCKNTIQKKYTKFERQLQKYYQ